MSSEMEQQVHQSILARDLLRQGDHIVVAVSGGPDSVALLAMFGGVVYTLEVGSEYWACESWSPWC